MRKMLTILVLSMCSWSLAQQQVLETSGDTEVELNEAPQQVATPDNKPNPEANSQGANTKNENQASAEVFRPSEEISEDLSVSFPVDI